MFGLRDAAVRMEYEVPVGVDVPDGGATYGNDIFVLRGV
jgi:hypothetical protein